MKTRMGFVSNSSSSSFIIALDAGVEPTAENFHQAIWHTDDELMFGPEYDNNPIVGSKVIALDIVRQVATADEDDWTGKMTDEKLAQVVNIPYAKWPELDDYRIEGVDRKDYMNAFDHDAYHKANDVLHAEEAAKVRTRFPGKDLYAVEFGDDTGFGCEVEHGDALRQDAVIRYSNH